MSGHLPGLAQIVDAAHLRAAFARAVSGVGLTYAVGPTPLGHADHPTLAQVRAWRDAGTATTAQGRDPRRPDQWIYTVYRIVRTGSASTGDAASDPGVFLSDPAIGPGRVNPADVRAAPSMPGVSGLTGNLERVLAALADAAVKGLPCPSYQQLADDLDLADRYAARRAVDRLDQAGVIRVISTDFSRGQKFRVIEITATGQRTAAPGGQSGGLA